MKNNSAFNGIWTHNPWFVSPPLYPLSYRGNLYCTWKIVKFKNIFAIMLLISVRPERVWPKLSSTQGIRANLVYIVSLSMMDWSWREHMTRNLLLNDLQTITNLIRNQNGGSFHKSHLHLGVSRWSEIVNFCLSTLGYECGQKIPKISNLICESSLNQNWL